MEQIQQGFSFSCRDDIIKQVFKSAEVLCEELTFNITPEGLTYRTMDPSQVALIDCTLPNAEFEKYNVNAEYRIAVRVDELNKVLSAFKKCYITFEASSDQILTIKNKETSFNLRMVEARVTDTPLPHLSYNSKLVLSTYAMKDFKRTLKSFNAISEYVTFKSESQNFVIESKGDAGNSRAKLERGDPGIPEMEHKEDLDASYSLEYLLDFLKSVGDYPITLEMSSKMPIRITMHCINTKFLSFYLAPRVEQ